MPMISAFFIFILALPAAHSAGLTPAQVGEILSRESKGVIQLDTEFKSTAVDPHGTPVTEPWFFEPTKAANVLQPSSVLQAEYVQSLYKIDTKKFTTLQNAASFIDAKEKYYRALKYSFSEKRYLQPQTTLTDWGGLNHPPLRSVQDEDIARSAEGKSKRDTAEFQRSIDDLSGSELTSGNVFSPFQDNDVVPVLLNVIQKTKTTLWGSALLFTCDGGTRPIVDALIERAEHGVDVRLMVDHTLQRMQKGGCVRELKKHGIKVIQVNGMIFKGSAFHVKLWMRDFEEGIFLGANLIDIQTQATAFNHLFHDSGTVVRGPAVTDMASRFLDLWQTYDTSLKEIDAKALAQIEAQRAVEKTQSLRGQVHYQEWLDARTPGLCRVVTQERHTERDRVSRVLGEYLKTARNRIWFSSVRRDFHETESHPEIGYNQLLLTVLDKAKTEGVRAEMMFNAATNPFTYDSIPDTGIETHKKGLLNWAMGKHLNHSTDRALKDGSKFFEKAHAEAPLFRAWSYFSYSHMKNLLIDDDFLVTGSYNPMDERSTNDAEIALFCQDRDLNKNYTRFMARDLANSLPYPYASQFEN